jgi:uncharacterized protein involved in exopolysaccharide biosynthesis
MEPDLTTRGQPLNFVDALTGALKVFIFLGENKIFIVRHVLTGIFLGSALYFVLPKSYTSETVIMPPQQTQSPLSAVSGMSALAGIGGIAVKTPDDVYEALLRSVSVLDELSEKFDLKERYHLSYKDDVRKKIVAQTRISSDKKSGLITIAVSDRSGDFAATLANGYVEALRGLLGRVAVSDAQQRRIFFESEVAKSVANLSTAELAFDVQKKKSGLASLSGQVETAVRSAAELRARISATEIQLASLHTYATKENPDVVRLVAEIDSMRGQLSALEQGPNVEPGASTSSKSGNDAAALAALRSFRELKYQQAVLEQLRSQLDIARIDEARQGPLVQQIDIAAPPEKKSAPKLLLSIGFGIFLGLFISLSRLAIREVSRTDEKYRDVAVRLKSAWKVRR